MLFFLGLAEGLCEEGRHFVLIYYWFLFFEELFRAQVLKNEDVCQSDCGDEEGDHDSGVDVELNLVEAVVAVAGGAIERLQDEEKEGRDQLYPQKVEKSQSAPPLLLLLISGRVLQVHHQRYQPIGCQDCCQVDDNEEKKVRDYVRQRQARNFQVRQWVIDLEQEHAAAVKDRAHDHE